MTEPIIHEETIINRLGESRFPSPLLFASAEGTGSAHFVCDTDRILHDIVVEKIKADFHAGRMPIAFEQAGPRQSIYFEPGTACAAIVTCGGLCPGINDVVRAMVMQLTHVYRCATIYGIRYGYAGFVDFEPIRLTPDIVDAHYNEGGTFLGSSRGPQDAARIVDRLQSLQVNMLFTIGGDGTLKGACDIYEETRRRKADIAVVGIPKTIDNDIPFVDKTFGYETAFSLACRAIECAHVESTGVYNGISLLKLMGRYSGFIAASATVANGNANFCLVPEVPFSIDGPRGFLSALEERIQRRHHAVVVIAEGAGQELMDSANTGTDASGNRLLGDIGDFLKDRITAHLKARAVPCYVRYLNPSYLIRSVPANPSDSLFCSELGVHAVHAGMAGKTGLMIGLSRNILIHIPMALAISRRKRLNPEGELWRSVLASTGQPPQMHD